MSQSSGGKSRVKQVSGTALAVGSSRSETTVSAWTVMPESCALSPTIENVLPFYLRKANSGQRVCLVTLFHVDNVSPRPEGSQIAVAEDGESFGFITGGCAEAAIVHEALLALKEKRSRKIRIGSDSPWFDIKLPCGAGIDLHFSVADSLDVVETTCKLLADRRPVSLELDLENDTLELVSEPALTNRETRPSCFVRRYFPLTRLAIIGAGPYVDALVDIAIQSDFEVAVWTPDASPEREVTSPRRFELARTTSFPEEQFDRWTAAVLLFHEHDWEPKILNSLLGTKCFYIGALGSRKTHSNRLKRLRELGINDEQLGRIHGPVGLRINARTPKEIAVSILAEIIATKNLVD